MVTSIGNLRLSVSGATGLNDPTRVPSTEITPRGRSNSISTSPDMWRSENVDRCGTAPTSVATDTVAGSTPSVARPAVGTVTRSARTAGKVDTGASAAAGVIAPAAALVRTGSCAALPGTVAATRHRRHAIQRTVPLKLEGRL